MESRKALSLLTIRMRPLNSKQRLLQLLAIGVSVCAFNTTTNPERMANFLGLRAVVSVIWQEVKSGK